MKDTGNLQYEYESFSGHVDTSIQEVNLSYNLIDS